MIEATLDAWCEQGGGDLSARSIAVRVGAAASSIYYHYNDIEHLYEAAQMVALKAAGEWCDAHIAELDGPAHVTALPGEALGPLLAMLIDDLCESRRRLAFAWRQCWMMAARNPRFVLLRDRWTAMWLGFWENICARFGLRESAALTALFFDGECYLHLMRWNRAADRACLEEMTAGWAGWLVGRVGRPAPWRAHVRAQARSSVIKDVLPDGAPRLIAAAAAELLATGGAGLVTHRAVATAAGLTLGVVSHHCRRTDDLLRTAFSEIYWRLTGSGPAGVKPDQAAPIAPTGQWSGAFQLLAIDELILAIARGQASADLVLRLRYLRGSTLRHTVIQRLGSRVGDAALEGAIYSSVMMALARLAFGRADEWGVAEHLRFGDQLFARLD